MRRATALVLATALLVAGGGCSRDDVKPGGARLDVVRGSRVMAGEAGETLRAVRGSVTLRRGARVEVADGAATLTLSGRSVLELRTGSEVELRSPVFLEQGDLLVSAEGRPVTISAGGSRVVVPGAARLSRELAVSAASYAGVTTLRSAGRSLKVPALRQAAIPSLGVLPADPQPLVYDARDPWDRRYLGAAIDLGEELEAKSRGFTLSLGRNEGFTAGFFRLLLPALEQEPAFGPALLAERRDPGETLVGATIAVSSERGSFTERWESVFSFRDEGAAWGLVALDQGVTDSSKLMGSLDAAIGRAPLAFAPPPAGGPARPPTTSPPTTGSVAGPRTPPRSSPPPAGGPATSTPPPTTTPTTTILPPPTLPLPKPGGGDQPGSGQPEPGAVQQVIDLLKGLLAAV